LEVDGSVEVGDSVREEGGAEHFVFDGVDEGAHFYMRRWIKDKFLE
jgi:hypothetical protein